MKQFLLYLILALVSLISACQSSTIENIAPDPKARAREGEGEGQEEKKTTENESYETVAYLVNTKDKSYKSIVYIVDTEDEYDKKIEDLDKTKYGSSKKVVYLDKTKYGSSKKVAYLTAKKDGCYRIELVYGSGECSDDGSYFSIGRGNDTRYKWTPPTESNSPRYNLEYE